jgi:exopolyphosphatase/guanosine-5'-triphosphate,3'-diphosphate pyrophosphatase
VLVCQGRALTCAIRPGIGRQFDLEDNTARQGAPSGLLEVPFPAAPTTLVGTAGTVTTLVTMSLGLTSYDPDLVHGHRLTLAALDYELARPRASNQPERERMAGLDPRRADVILAGACILRQIAAQAAASEILVSDRGIRWGLLYERAGASR